MRDIDERIGVYRKYRVQRLGDKAKKHAQCEYYVLDLEHDRFAGPALSAYADACEATHPELARDLRYKAALIEHRIARELKASLSSSHASATNEKGKAT